MYQKQVIIYGPQEIKQEIKKAIDIYFLLFTCIP